MKTQFLAIITLIFTNFSICQNIEWTRGEWSSEIPTEINEFDDESILVSSFYYSSINTRRVTANGNTLWNIDVGGKTAIDNNNNVYILFPVKTQINLDPGVSDYTITPASSGSSKTSNIALAKYDGNGNFLWVVDLEFSEEISPHNPNGFLANSNLLIDSNNQPIISSYLQLSSSISSCDVNMDPNNQTSQIASFSSGRIMYAKYTAQGDFLWVNFDLASSLSCIASNDKVYLLSSNQNYDSLKVMELNQNGIDSHLFTIDKLSDWSGSGLTRQQFKIDDSLNFYLTENYKNENFQTDYFSRICSLRKFNINGNEINSFQYTLLNQYNPGENIFDFYNVILDGNKIHIGLKSGFSYINQENTYIPKGAYIITLNKSTFNKIKEVIFYSDHAELLVDVSSPDGVLVRTYHVSGDKYYFAGQLPYEYITVNFDESSSNYTLDATTHRKGFVNKYCFTPADNVILGDTSLCANTEATYTLDNDEQNTTYNWSVPANWNIVDNNDEIDVIPDISNGSISVYAQNNCGVSDTLSINIDIVEDTPPVPQNLIGDNQFCPNNTLDYSCQDVLSADSLVWSLPFGWSGYSNTNTLQANAGAQASSGYISVSSANICGLSDSTYIFVDSEIDNTITIEEYSDSVTLVANATNVDYQWVDCNNNFDPIAGANNQEFTPTSYGSYAVSVENSNGCIGVSNCFDYIDETNSIKGHDLKNINIYPNPSNSIVNIDFSNPLPAHTELKVISLEGRSVITKNLPANTLNTTLPVEELTNGTYFIRIGSEVRKLIKK